MPSKNESNDNYLGLKSQIWELITSTEKVSLSLNEYRFQDTNLVREILIFEHQDNLLKTRKSQFKIRRFPDFEG